MFRLFAVLALVTASAFAERPEKWAQPVCGTSVPNLHRVTPRVYRSAQPDAPGMRAIEKLGVWTMINLRDFHSDAAEARGTHLRLRRVKMSTWHIEDEDIIRVLAMLRRRPDGPFLIHCQHGSDRTGVICAMYRMVEEGWAPDEAITEMMDGGYGFHPMWRNIPRYLRHVDVRAMRGAVEKASRQADHQG